MLSSVRCLLESFLPSGVIFLPLRREASGVISYHCMRIFSQREWVVSSGTRWEFVLQRDRSPHSDDPLRDSAIHVIQPF